MLGNTICSLGILWARPIGPNVTPESTFYLCYLLGRSNHGGRDVVMILHFGTTKCFNTVDGRNPKQPPGMYKAL